MARDERVRDIDPETPRGISVLNSTTPERKPVTLNERKVNVFCGYIAPIIGIIFLSIFFITLLGLFWGTEYNSDKYSEVIVTPFGEEDYPFTTNETEITQPCYYPVYTTNVTGAIACNASSNGTDYYCPKNFDCITDAKLFASPYVGCMNFNVTCGDASICVPLIDGLPAHDELAKTLTLTCSSTLLRLFACGGIFFIILTVFVITARFFFRARITNFSIQYTILSLLLLIVTYVVIVVLGGLYFSMDLVTVNGNCFSNSDLNSTIGSLKGIYIGYLEIYCLGTTLGGVLIYMIVIGLVAIIYLKFLRKNNQSVNALETPNELELKLDTLETPKETLQV